MKKAIAYYRISTKKQPYGIDVQKEYVHHFCIANNIEIISEFEECVSGKNGIQKELLKALQECKTNNCSIVCTRPDRLTRNINFGLIICQTQDVIFSDFPNLTLEEKIEHFTCASKEVDLISRRTKEALALLKERGVKLGNPNAEFTEEMRQNAYKKRHQQALDAKENKRAYELIKDLVNLSYTKKAEYLNSLGLKTVKGYNWSTQGVKRLIYLNEPDTKIEELNKKERNKDNESIAYELIKNMSGTYEQKARYLNERGCYTKLGAKWYGDGVKKLILKYEPDFEKDRNKENNKRAYDAISDKYRWSPQKRADFLNENGYRTNTGKLFTANNIKYIIHKYGGIYYDEEPNKQAYDAISSTYGWNNQKRADFLNENGYRTNMGVPFTAAYIKHLLFKYGGIHREEEQDPNRLAYNAIRDMTCSIKDKTEYLNNNGYTTTYGKKWKISNVINIICKFREEIKGEE